ncbi:MAG: GTP cyclohydrolase I FolE [Chloroflexi bacterium]|nr:GTP cyclohydrolase I FolE [Chloroflexota bacterium]
MRLNKERIQKAVREILEAIGEDPQREGLLQTPERIAEAYAELFSGLSQDPKEVLSVGYEKPAGQEMVVLRDIPFYSVCEHHLLPFHGLAHVGYVPSTKVVGVSKLARVVEILARRPQMQERLTSQIADTIMESLSPRGVAVVIDAAADRGRRRRDGLPGSQRTPAAHQAGRRRLRRGQRPQGNHRALGRLLHPRRGCVSGCATQFRHLDSGNRALLV